VKDEIVIEKTAEYPPNCCTFEMLIVRCFFSGEGLGLVAIDYIFMMQVWK